METLLREDVRNNSAWNHRWFLCFGRDELRRTKKKPVKATSWGGEGETGGETPTTTTGTVVDEELIDREVAFAQGKILLAPQNQSPWTYLRALYRKAGRPLEELRGFVEQFAGEEEDAEEEEKEAEDAEGGADVGKSKGRKNVDEGVRSSHALDLLAEIYAEGGEVVAARRVLEALGRRWDPVRKGYWDYRIALLGGGALGEGEEESEEEGEG